MKKIPMRSLSRVLRSSRQPFHDGYYAMFSSVLGGIVTDPVLMLVPVDDHIVHRGDGVFETMKCVRGRIYNMQAHLARLSHSASSLGLRLPAATNEIGRIVVETVRAGEHRDCGIRLYASRGRGSFSVNPYDCRTSELYVIVTRLDKPFMRGHPEGARVATSSVPPKPPFFAGVKSCNYLPNVLMKKEAVDAGLDFVVSFDSRGFLGEGATENMGIVTRRKKLLFPRLDGVLRGTTMMRVMLLAEELVRSGVLKEAAFCDISKRAIRNAAEAVIVGTTRDVVMVREFDDRPIGDGSPGPVYKALSALLSDDMHGNRDLLTPAFE